MQEDQDGDSQEQDDDLDEAEIDLLFSSAHDQEE